MVLHFSGHGIENNVAYFGKSHVFYKDKGNMLLLENESGQAEYLFEVSIREYMQNSK